MPRPAKKNRISQIGHNIKLVREVVFRWPVKIFAEKMEVSEHTVRDWENGRTDIPHYRVVQAAKIFNMTLPELETAHQYPLVHIESQHNNQEINNIGTMHSDLEGQNEFIQELRADKAELKEQLAKRDAHVEKLKKQVDELLAKLGQQ